MVLANALRLNSNRCSRVALVNSYRQMSAYPGSSNYREGKEGFAPGFPPPKGWRDAPRKKPEPQLATDLPPRSAKQTYVPKLSSAANNPARQYKMKLRSLRYTYLHDHLVKEEEKREKHQKSLKRAFQIQSERAQRLQQERQEYETKVRADPLSAENVLNAEGKTLLSNIPKEEKSAAGYELAPPRVSISMPKEANEKRQMERTQNRQLTDQRRKEDNVQKMMALFHESEHFVHYKNLDRKVLDAIGISSGSYRSLGELTDTLKSGGGIVTPAESARRTNELRNVLQGAAGSQGKLGYDGLIKWLDNHPEDAERANFKK